MTTQLSVPKEKLKFVLLEGIHPWAVDALRQDGYTQVATSPKALAGDALIEQISDAHFLGIRSRTLLPESVLAQAPKLTAIGCFCIGTNQVDLAAAMRRGIPVFNAPFSNTRSVAELVLAEIIMLLRGIPHKNAVLHRNGWVKSAARSYEVRGKTLGIVGYGHIGTQIGVLAEQLGMSVIFFDIETKLPLGNARQIDTLGALLEAADVVSLHVPETPATRNMMAADELAKMKPGSHLINASRGTVVDIDALAAALETEHLHGAAIDVFPLEPQGNEARFESPLTRFDNVLLTPHIGGSTAEAQANIGREVAAKLIRYSNNGSTASAVNFRGHAARTYRPLACAAHPQERAGHHGADQRALFRSGNQHRCPIPADQRRGRLCGDRRRQQRPADRAGRSVRNPWDDPMPRSVLTADAAGRAET